MFEVGDISFGFDSNSVWELEILRETKPRYLMNGSKQPPNLMQPEFERKKTAEFQSTLPSSLVGS